MHEIVAVATPTRLTSLADLPLAGGGIRCLPLLVLAAAVAMMPVRGFAGELYSGKSIDLVIGTPPGGGYDIYARALARHLGRHIPGQPAIVAKNMPGAGSARAAGFITAVAPRDGTVTPPSRRAR
jgi:tripartite-type tricarboxylate transporter receptor subunit TctC